MIGDAPVRAPIVYGFLSRVIRMVLAQLIQVHPFLWMRIDFQLLLQHLPQVPDVITDLDEEGGHLLEGDDFFFCQHVICFLIVNTGFHSCGRKRKEP